ESLVLQNQLTIKLLIAGLEYILHPREDFYAVKLNYLYAKFLQKENTESFLSKRNEGKYFFEEEMPFLDRKNISRLSSTGINEIVFLLMNAMKLDVQMNNYLFRFQDIVLQQSQQQCNTIQDFLEYWNEQKHKLCIIPPDGIDAVKIYTIHKAKGLQFPVVILPYANWNMKPKHDSTIWLKSVEQPFDQLHAFPVEMVKKIEDSFFSDAYASELELTYMDNINLLYVAFTRAEEQLYIFSTAEKEGKEEALPQNVCRLLRTIIGKIGLNDSTFFGNEFVYGTVNTNRNDDTQCLSTKNITSRAFNNYKEQIKLKRSREYNEAQVKGNILHLILSKINQPEQLHWAIRTTVTNDAELDAYSKATEKALEIFTNKKWFDKKWQHINERNLHYKDELLRADKILLSDDECIIIDYKTGVKETEHEKQLKKYAEAYSTIFKHKISAYLLYTDTLEVQQI
ncbi:MAG: hypothetical protein JWN78_626, partial [Bacteroidota bacterium]|nr:hypothetical protein [Bacteroidota bacterium]